MALAFTGRAIHTLTMPEIEAYMRKAAPGASSWNHLRVALVGLFNHAEERGLPAVFAPADAGTLQFRATA